MKPRSLRKKYNRDSNWACFFGLVIAYVVGMDLFVYLKMLGLHELSEVSVDARKALLPLSTCMGLLISFTIALLELNVFNRWKYYTFGRFVLYKYSIIVFLVIAGCIGVFICFILFVEKQTVAVALSTVPDFLRTEIFLSIFLYLILFSVFLNVTKTIAEYLGPRAIVSALIGKYNQPAVEDLTFIFIDLRSSTTIAERLGHAKYSRFIDKSFQLLTESIYEYGAVIYQFVGDEAVLLWRTDTACKTLSPVNLYYHFVQRLKEEEEHFLDEFGEMPHFRAAVHTGLVTVAEIRTLKRDVVYHGDVLNTCARILEQCSLLNKDLLVSASVAGWIRQSDQYVTTMMGGLLLRGKVELTNVYEVVPVDRSKIH